VVRTGRVGLVERSETLGQRDDLFSLVIEGRPDRSSAKAVQP
jgi:hypothetical protein